jgi:hypothetical protein
MAGTITALLTTVSLADTITGWSGSSGQLDTEVYKQAATIGSDGAYTYQTGKNSLENCTFTPATNINMTANYTTPHLYWTMRCDVFPFCEALNTGTTNSGLMVRVTDGSGNYKQWHVAGSDTWDGSWRTFVLDLTSTASHSSSGTLSLADVDVITWYTDNSNSGNIRIIDNTWLDAIRYGDGLQAESTTTEAFDFDDIALDDALTANYYGVLQRFYGILAGQGMIEVGDDTGSGTANLVSRNEQIVFQDQLVSSSHYGVRAVASATATTDVDIQGAVLITIGDTGAEIDFSDANINSIVFTDSTLIDMGTIDYQSGADCRRNVYSGCDQITPDGADMRDSSISGYEGTAGTAALVYNNSADPDGEFDGLAITKGTAATAAIEFGATSPSSITLRNCTFSGYNAADDQNDSTFYFSDTNSGNTYTLNLNGCTGNVKVRTAGCVVNVVQDPVQTLITVSDITDNVVIQGARVLLYVDSGVNYPYQASVTIVSSGTTATVTHTAHGLETGDKVMIRGANEEEYNIVASITVTNVNTYTYTIVATTSPATGTITATYVILDGTTNASGQISDTRAWSNAQPVRGRVADYSGSPYYQRSPISGETISTSSGLTLNKQLLRDE